MKNIFLGVSLLLCVNTFAQDCGELKEKKDPFTNKTERSARVTIGNMMTKWSVEIKQSENETYMKWSIAMQGEFNQKFDVGTPLLLKLEDGSVVRVESSEPSSPVTQALSGGAGTVNVFTVYHLKYDLTKEILASLAKSIITDIKVDVPGQQIKNPKIKDRQMGKLQDVFSCLLKG